MFYLSDLLLNVIGFS
ncbi:small protein SpfP [Hafnia psychrotolerans]